MKVLLSEVAHRVTKGTTPTTSGGRFVESGVAFVKVESIEDDGAIDHSKLSYIDEETNALLARSRLAEDDILFTIAGSIGRVALVKKSLLPANTNQAVAIVRPNSDRVFPRFLYYALRDKNKIDEALANTVQSVQANFSLSELGKLVIELPDRAAQQATAHILGTLDDKIEQSRRISQTLQAIAQAIFQSWFVDFDPVRAKASGEETAEIQARLGLGEATQSLFPSKLTSHGPSGWQPVTLKQLTTKIGSGATPRGGREVYIEEGIALIRSQNVYDSQFVWDGLARITDVAALQLANVEVQAGDVLLNITGASILRTCVVPPDALPARVNQHVAIIRAKPGVPPHFLHLHLLQADTKAYLLGLNAGASREAVTKAHIESVPLLDPGPDLLATFHRTVAPLFAQAQLCAAEARALSAVRDALLPRLLSGALSVPLETEP